MRVERSDFYDNVRVLESATCAWARGLHEEALTTVEELWMQLQDVRDPKTEAWLKPRLRSFLAHARSRSRRTHVS